MSNLYGGKWEIFKFAYRTKRNTRIVGYTVKCANCGKRSRLVYYAGGYKFACHHCGSDGGGDCYPPT